jgi:hypothetical protein
MFKLSLLLLLWLLWLMAVLLFTPAAQAEALSDKQAVDYLLRRSAALEIETAQANAVKDQALVERRHWLLRYQALSECIREASTQAESKECLGDTPL